MNWSFNFIIFNIFFYLFVKRLNFNLFPFKKSFVQQLIFLQEIVILTDKWDISEEIARLKSHILKFRQTGDEKDSAGRKLDFIAQEMNREANTILSKANDLDVSNHAINLKTEIEKIREQIQNIE